MTEKMIRLAGMYEKTSAKTGARFLAFHHPDAGNDEPDWTLYLAQAENTLTPEAVEAWKQRQGEKPAPASPAPPPAHTATGEAGLAGAGDRSGAFAR